MLQRVLSQREDFTSKVKRVLGNLKFLYYRYLEEFHQVPRDIDDLIDGLIYCKITEDERSFKIEEKTKHHGK